MNPDSLRIGILLYDGFSLLDAAGPADLLGRLPHGTVTTVAEQGGPVRTDTGGVAMLADHSFAEIDHLDVLIVPGANERGTVRAMENETLLDWIRRIHEHTAWTASVCTGSLVLGQAGLLRDRATTYWASANYLERTFGVEYVPERYVRSGKVVTAAGVSAGIDMTLYLLIQLVGEQMARAVQLAVEYDPRPPLDSGDLAKASEELRELSLRLVNESARRPSPA